MNAKEKPKAEDYIRLGLKNIHLANHPNVGDRDMLIRLAKSQLDQAIKILK